MDCVWNCSQVKELKSGNIGQYVVESGSGTGRNTTTMLFEGIFLFFIIYFTFILNFIFQKINLIL